LTRQLHRSIQSNYIPYHEQYQAAEAYAPTDLEKTVGLSYRYLREEFRNYTKMPLKQYINARKIANIIFEMETTDKTLLTLATEYGFDAYDTFTRCFKRELCITPNQYKNEHRRTVERKLIGMGTYAPVVANMLMSKLQFPGLQEDSYILYGVPRVEFSLKMVG